MDIQEFIELQAGKWFSLRTSYKLADRKVENNKAEISIVNLAPDAPEIQELSDKHGSGQPLGGFRYSWDNSIDYGQNKQTGSSLIVLIPDKDNPATGRLIKSTPGNPSLAGNYNLRADEALTLTLEKDGVEIEERIWFASPNLKLRTSIITAPDNSRQTVFYSEIRKMS